MQKLLSRAVLSTSVSPLLTQRVLFQNPCSIVYRIDNIRLFSNKIYTKNTSKIVYEQDLNENEIKEFTHFVRQCNTREKMLNTEKKKLENIAIILEAFSVLFGISTVVAIMSVITYSYFKN